jgi:hypothetical protein
VDSGQGAVGGDNLTPASLLAVSVGIESRLRSQFGRTLLLVRLRDWLRLHMTDECWIGLVAAMLSIGFYVWYDARGITLAFNDARLRELIARRVIAGLTPGLAQLGVTWLPLPSILMLPMIWSNALFRSGIAGSLPSMAAYVVASIYMYRIVKLVTSSRGAAWVGAGVLMLNPSLLYMQSTAMSETASLSAFVVSIYYALRLMQTNHAADIVKCAAAVAAGTLIRYENWFLAIAIVPFLAYAGWRRRGYVLAEAWTILYALLAFAGCIAWIVYNAIIFHDPLLSFYYGQPSHKYYANAPAALLPGRHHPLVAFEMYGYTVAGTVGWLILGIAVVGLIVFLWRSRLQDRTLPAYLTLVPFVFYWTVLYRGINTEGLPRLGLGGYYNIRFGLLMIPAVALFFAFVIVAARPSLRWVLVGCAIAMIAGTSVVGSTLETPFVLREALHGPQSAGAHSAETAAKWLASHYRGGEILIAYVNDSGIIFYLMTKHKVPDSAFVTDTNGSQFTHALAYPEDSVKWVVMNSQAFTYRSPIWVSLHNRKDWRPYFIFRKKVGTSLIYERL